MSHALWLPVAFLALACTQTPPTVAQGNTAALPVVAKQADLAKEVARGKVVYSEEKCQACHSIDGVGNRRNPLDGVADKLSSADIRRWIIAPREMNPRVTKRAYKLPAEDLDALVAYLQQLRKK